MPRTDSRNSPLYAEPYVMPFQAPPTTDNPDAAPLLTEWEFKTLVIALKDDTRTSHRVLIRAAMMAFISSTIWRWWGLVPALVSLVFVFMLVTEFTVFIVLRKIDKKQPTAERLIRFIENTQDAGLLGTIIDLYVAAGRLGDTWHEVSNAAFTAAMRLLPLLKSSHAYSLNTQHRVFLRQVMFLPKSVQRIDRWLGLEYCLPMVYALKQIGDKRDLPDVERLLKQPYITEEIRTAAEHCAQTIWERVTHEEGKNFLLRADRKPEAVATLLRPSVERDDTPPEQLLRAATSDEGNTPA